MNKKHLVALIAVVTLLLPLRRTFADVISSVITVDGTHPYGIAAIGSNVYTANYTNGSVTVINTLNNNSTSTIPVGKGPVSFAVLGSKLFVSDFSSSSVSVIDTANGNTVTNVGVGASPYQAAILGSKVYVPNSGASTVSIIDTANGNATSTITVGTHPYFALAVGSIVYTANFGSSTVSAIDTSNNNAVTSISVGANPEWLASLGTKIYVANSGTSTVSIIDTANGDSVTNVNVGKYPYALTVVGNNVYTANYSASGGVSIIDGTTNAVTPLSLGTAGPVSITYLNGYIYTANFAGNSVSVINAANTNSTSTLSGVFSGPRGFATLGSTVYVANYNSNSIVAIQQPIAPTLSASVASSISTTTATLNGSMASDGYASSTIEGFNYGTTTAYGLIASTAGMYGTGSFSDSITGLVSGTTYHFQSFATNPYGTGTSSDMTFTTSAGLPSVTTNAASSIDEYDAVLNATVANDGGASSTIRGFEYGTTTSYGSVVSTTGSFGEGAFNNSVTGLSAQTLYHYRAFVTNSAGTASSSDQTFTTGSGGAGVLYNNGVTSGSTTGTGSTGASSLITWINGYPYLTSSLASSSVTVATSSSALFSNSNVSGVATSVATTSAVAAGSSMTVSSQATACPVGFTCTQVLPMSSAVSAPANTQASSIHYTFARNLFLGMTGNDVRQLQAYLNAHGFIIASSGAGSPGKETARFGPATKNALARFQKANGISPAVGYFGPLTRGVVNSLR